MVSSYIIVSSSFYTTSRDTALVILFNDDYKLGEYPSCDTSLILDYYPEANTAAASDNAGSASKDY